MASRSGQVRVAITLDDKGLTSGAKRAEGTLGRLGKTGGGHARSLAKSLGGVVAGLGAVAGAKQAIATTETLAKSTLGLHNAFGLTVADASRWAGIMQARGVDGTKLTMGFKTLSTQLQAARGGGAAAVKQFDALGISQSELKKHGTDLNWEPTAGSVGRFSVLVGVGRGR